jgi:hypothetical protein
MHPGLPVREAIFSFSNLQKLCCKIFDALDKPIKGLAKLPNRFDQEAGIHCNTIGLLEPRGVDVLWLVQSAIG